MPNEDDNEIVVGGLYACPKCATQFRLTDYALRRARQNEGKLACNACQGCFDLSALTRVDKGVDISTSITYRQK